ncbi:MAG TPA: HEAT repeat domain-containing protein [Gemmataceae bacterium]|nr:HEAT repeat domain-containing protein [Gemmataceae bacterium]
MGGVMRPSGNRSDSPIALAFVLACVMASVGRGEDLGVRVAPGFRVTLYADQDLANDIYAMTLDSNGRVVVTSRGYVKVLHDTRGTGKADRATLYAETASGGMGLCFDGNDLYFCGDGWLSRYRASRGQGRADGPPQHLIPLAFSEHGGHAMRKGPDGYWYVIGGNDSGIGRRHVTASRSPVRNPEAGALLRLDPDGRSCEVFAHGFRNPYDFDFNAAGDLFTYDSDCERDFFLPWYSPTRVYHIAPGGHHGWHLTGYLRSWARPDYYMDTVDMLWPVGRGSPTGVVCYRHDQFPEHYRGGLFALDWTFGKVYFFPLRADGASYRTRPEVFLEPTGTHGFAPTDVAVAPDGSLFVCIGGRLTRGAVYRIEYVGDGKKPVTPAAAPASDVDEVLHARQPLDAWSRARWVPLARKLGPKSFAAAVVDGARDAPGRVRAVEVLTELFGGLPPAAARQGATAAAPLVRSRVAWSLGRQPCRDFAPILYKLANDSHLRVRSQALDALAERLPEVDAERARRVLPPNLADADKRVRQAAAHLAALLPDAAWKALQKDLAPGPPQARLTAALAAVWRSPAAVFHDAVVEEALSVLRETKDSQLRLQALRLIILGLGDFHWKDPPVEVYTGYELQPSLHGREKTARRVIEAVRPLFPSGDRRLDEESSRLLAMLEDDDAALPGKVAARWTRNSSATEDMHYLVVFSRLRGPHEGALTAPEAEAVLALDRKLKGQQERNKQTWNLRLAEVVTSLVRRDPALQEALLRHPDFARPAHVTLAACFDADHRLKAARQFLAAVRRDDDFAWSGPLVELLVLLPAKEVRPQFRAQWPSFALRDGLLLQLGKKPEVIDRDKFLAGLDSAENGVVRACLSALAALPRDPQPRNLVPVLHLLRRLQQEPKQRELRARALALLARQTGRAFTIKEATTGAAALKKAYQPVFDWFEHRHPALVAALNSADAEDAEAWNRLLQSVAWEGGDARRGEKLFRERGCMSCHAGPSKLGPDLTGAASRFSRADLFTAIIYPSRDIAPLYRTTVFETHGGQVFSGLVVFESADGVILQTGASTTVRLSTDDIASRLPGSRSLMPDGLLKGLRPLDLADLYRYLQTLRPQAVADSPAGKSRK